MCIVEPIPEDLQRLKVALEGTKICEGGKGALEGGKRKKERKKERRGRRVGQLSMTTTGLGTWVVL